MALLKLVLISTFSVVLLFFLAKLMGNKQMSELNMFDYIIGISIGSIAAEMATELEQFWKPLAAMTVYALIATGFSLLCEKSIKFRRFGFGKTLLLFKDGTLYKENMKKAKVDMNELLMLCRNNGYFDLTELSVVLIEPNGKMSFLPLSQKRPVSASDIGIVPKKDNLVYNLIIDGRIMESNLRYSGRNEKWLMNELKAQKVKDIERVLLAAYDGEKLTVYPASNKKITSDIFE